MLKELFAAHSRLLLFDTETTGLEFDKDEIIEFAAIAVELQNGQPVVIREYDELITLSPGKTVPTFIQELTGISDEDIRSRGLPKTRICCDLADMLTEDTLLIAYNAHFDLCFLYYLLMKDGNPALLKGKDKLDLYTVYKDRKPYPHKLCNAIEAYGLAGSVVNSHRAVDDVLATLKVMEAMATEKDDLHKYLNLFGYHPKYGIPKHPIRSVTYKPQPYDAPLPLYET